MPKVISALIGGLSRYDVVVVGALRDALALTSIMPALATTCCAPSTRPTAQMRSSAASCSSSARNGGPSRSQTAACLLGMHARPWRGCKPRAEDSPTFKVAYPKTVPAGRPLRQPYYSFNLMTWMLAGSGIRKIGPRQVRAAANANSAEGNFEACPACSPSQANQSDEVLTRYVSCPAIAWFEPLGAITPRATYSILPPHAVAPARCKRLRSLMPSSYQAETSLALQRFCSPPRPRPVVPIAREVAVAARICSYSSFRGKRSCGTHLQATTDAASHCGQPNPAAGNTSLPSFPFCSSGSLGQEADGADARSRIL